MTYKLSVAWQKYKSGDVIGDTELCRLIDDLNQLEQRLKALGPTLHLAWKEVASALRSCEDYATARGFVEKKGLTHSLWFPTERKAIAALGPELPVSAAVPWSAQNG